MDQRAKDSDEGVDGPSGASIDSLLARVAATEHAQHPTGVPEVAGRYEVGRRLGRGGLGIVNAGWDPQLRREVALKFVRPDRLAGERGHALAVRLRREAQVLARLDHPSVVRVFDTGEVAGQLFIAMELLDGGTLRAWAHERRSWRAIASACLAAAHGLAAAHRSGVVHRDFKPDNVIVCVGADGSERVVVVDFGLADPEWSESPSADDVAEGGDAASSERLTESGTILGTRHYMAPELWEGDPASPASDQFSFCVSLDELVSGDHLAGSPEPGPRDPAPRWLRALIERGLSPVPARRFPSMEALIAELERGLAAPKRRAVGTFAAVAITGACVGVWPLLAERRAIAGCESEGAAIERLWNLEARAEVREALLVTDVAYAERTVERVVPWLDQRAQDWREARTEACLDARVRAIWDEDMLDRSLWCMQEHWVDLEATIGKLTHADPDVVQRAVLSAAPTSSVSDCRDAELLASLPAPPPSEQRAGMNDVRRDLATSRALEISGKHAASVDLARDTLARAVELGWEPLVAEARLRHGRALRSLGQYAEAQTEDERAYFSAGEIGASAIAVDAAEELVALHSQLARKADALAWSRHAEAVLTRLPHDEFRQSVHFNTLAHVHRVAGAPDQAKPLFERAVAIRTAVLGPDHPTLGRVLNNLAITHAQLGELTEAKAIIARALALQESAFGPAHPEVARSLHTLATIHGEANELTEAREILTRALAIQESAFGPEDREIALTLGNLAHIDLLDGAFESARAHADRGLAIMQVRFGPDHPELRAFYQVLEIARERLGDEVGARDAASRAARITEVIDAEARLAGKRR